MRQAQNLSEIHQSCEPRPLEPAELSEFFVETAQARDPVLSRREELRELLPKKPRAKVLLAGHTGCGKSTELVKLSQEVKDRYLVVNLRIREECNLFHVPVEDLLVAMMERLLDACSRDARAAGKLAEAQETLKEIQRWFATELDIDEQKVSTGIEASAGANASQSLLGKVLGLLGGVKLDIRRGGERLHRVTQEKPHRLSALAERCNTLIRAAHTALYESGRELLIVAEDLDKLNLADARRIFVDQPTILADLGCAVICTASIFLLHSPDKGAFEPYYDTRVLPMPQLRHFDGSPHAAGEAAVREIIRRRVAPGLIQEPALALLLEKSGGVLRNIFEVLLVAAQAAESLHARGEQPENAIIEANVRYGLNRLKSEYARSITVLNLPPAWKEVKLADLYARLRTFAQGRRRILESDEAAMVLLNARAILEYNGEGWFDLHPLVRELLPLFPE